MTLNYHLGYLETILVHPTRRQSFSGKSDSTFYNIWNLVIWNTSVFLYQLFWGGSVQKSSCTWGCIILVGESSAQILPTCNAAHFAGHTGGKQSPNCIMAHTFWPGSLQQLNFGELWWFSCGRLPPVRIFIFWKCSTGHMFMTLF